ncbi:MAG: hypothetical protein QOI23_1428, partial [Chloroflexota bacterium]|nr:hypothetical protein [Chloroflexota bacterium]
LLNNSSMRGSLPFELKVRNRRRARRADDRGLGQPISSRYVSLAVSLISGMPASALDTGHASLACSA